MERKKSFRGNSSHDAPRRERGNSERAERGHRTFDDRRRGSARKEDGNESNSPSRGYRRDGNNQRSEFRPGAGSFGKNETKSRFAKPERRESNDNRQREFRPGYNEERPTNQNGRNSGKKPGFGSSSRNSEERKQWRSYASDRRSWDGRTNNDNREDYANNEKHEKVVRNYIKKKESNTTTAKVEKDPNQMRLNRFIANSGVCSRRDADTLIQNGEITVNGQVVTALGTIISKDDIVKYNGKKLDAQRKVYILLNKPKGVVTTADDPEERTTVMDIIADACDERVYPVGRLDRNTTGLLLMTNDGELAKKLTHPKYECRKIYHVFANKSVKEEHLFQLAEGITLDDGPINADKISYVESGDKSQVGVEIHSGRNRIVRRMFEHLGYEVEKLDRVYFAGLTKVGIPRGKWRFLTEKEISKLKAGFFK